jgi:hypothetical protein
MFLLNGMCVMLRHVWSACVVLLGAGCTGLGENSIIADRNFYNEVIRNTSREQLLLNIVRVAKDESLQFIDVSEVDAVVSIAASATGQTTNIGARAGTSGGTLAGQVGNLSGSFAYGESPTIRYLPLLGGPLIAQLSSPIKVSSISSLFNSDWPMISVLALVADRLTPAYADFEPALDTLFLLDTYGAITLGAAKAGVDKDSAEELAIYLHPEGTFHGKMAEAYAKFGPDYLQQIGPGACNLAHERAAAARQHVGRLWDQLLGFYTDKKSQSQDAHDGPDKKSQSQDAHYGSDKKNGSQDVLYLKAEPEAARKSKTGPPLSLRSALGVLRQGQFDPIRIKPASEARQIRESNSAQNSPCVQQGTFYFIPHPGEIQPEQYWEDLMQIGTKERRITDAQKEDFRAKEYESRLNRVYLLVEESDDPPSNASVSVRYRGKWYSIDADDSVSKTTFALIGQIVTIQAVPNPTPPLASSLNVGPRTSP